MTNYLDKIWEYKKQELEAGKRRRSLTDVKAAARDVEPPRAFYECLTSVHNTTPRIIAEVKKASPSQGVIVADFDAVAIAGVYEEHGAKALSVLTDEHFFQGELGLIAEIKQVRSLPVLRKDFTLDEYHLYEARAAGADAVLLIARMLSRSQVEEYREMTQEMGMATLVEIHDDDDLAKIALNKNNVKQARLLLGINNRDLSTFETDLAVSERLAQNIPDDVPLVSESGIYTREDIDRLEAAGIHIFLIGESLLRAKDMGEKLSELMGMPES